MFRKKDASQKENNNLIENYQQDPTVKILDKNENKLDDFEQELKHKPFKERFKYKLYTFRWKRLFAIVSLIVCIIFFGFTWFIISLGGSSVKSFGEGNTISSFFNAGKNILTGDRTELDGESEGRTNLLVLGLAKEGGTDTIILMSYYHEEKKFAAITIPRDLYVADGYYDEDGEWTRTWNTKINGAYVFAENRENQKPESERVEPAQRVADLITHEYEIPIHYWSVINFQGVEDFIDLFDGINVDVERTFTDCSFPNESFGYLPCQTFEEGNQYMDGETALIYARSRKGNNGEGSDFARSARQTNVIESLMVKAKEEIDNGNAITINKMSKYFEVFGNNVKTSMEIDEALSFYQIFSDNNGNSDGLDSLFYRTSWQPGNGFLYETSSDDTGYIITYVDGTVPMSANTYSQSRNLAKEQIQNMLETVQYADTYNSTVVTFGNRSDLTQVVQDSLENAGMQKLWTPVYNYSYIEPATIDSIETATFYIEDSSLRSSFSELAEKYFTFEYSIQGEITEDKVISQINKEADIITWIESK